MFRRVVLTPLVVFAISIVMGVLALGFLCGQRVDSIGGTNLHIDFLIVDADSSEPIANAQIHIRCASGCWYDGAEMDMEKPFTLQTDAAGMAHRLCRDNWWVTNHSCWNFSNAYLVWIPGWEVRVLADGFKPGPAMDMGEEYRGQVKHEGELQDRLSVRISLHKRRGM